MTRQSAFPLKQKLSVAVSWWRVGRESEATIRVWMRYRADVTAASRLVVLNGPFKGLTLEVVGPPIPDAKSTRLEILCKQGWYRD
jgi:head-tail adaptor